MCNYYRTFDENNCMCIYYMIDEGFIRGLVSLHILDFIFAFSASSTLVRYSREFLIMTVFLLFDERDVMM